MWITAIVLGLAGSLHCLGMCSPLAIAVTSLRQPFFINRLVYNLGRILTYGVLGMLVSSFGTLFSLSGFQNVLTVALGAVLILMGAAGASSIRVPWLTSVITSVTIRIKNLFSVFLKKKTLSAMMCMGMLNGLLPCGLTFLALSYCVTVSSVGRGFLFMILFGAGTLPVMLGLTSVLQAMIVRFNISFKKLTTYTLIALGIVLISRSFYSHSPAHSQAAQAEIVICR